MNKITLNRIAAILYLGLFQTTANAQKPVWQSKEFAIYKDSIIQPPFVAHAISGSDLNSNYQSPSNHFVSPKITFKFSINGKDNEMPSGMDHHFNYLSTNGYAETPLIVYGKQWNDTSVVPENLFLAPNVVLKIRLDMRLVLSDLREKGFYTTFKGDKIYKEDLKAVYVAGNTAPLIWDFDNLVNHPPLLMTDPDGDGIYETTLTLNVAKEKPKTAPDWHLTKNISAFPQYVSDFPMTNAIYNMSLEEMQRAIEPDSTFRTGKEWAGVWTRDISYSIILSMAHLQPVVAKNSLLRKVNKKGRIIQDTGSGGAWPVSTDRMIWAVAAFELYKVTGDMAWLKQAYQIVRNSIDDDMENIYDPGTGLVRGESSFLDWREQTYPKWMQPADIFQSENLGTNAVHYQANRVLYQMATLLHENKSAERYQKNAERIKYGINTYLWKSDKGYYGQYRYGRNFQILSPRSEALGEALCVIFDIADSARQLQILSRTPVTPFGISCIWPQIPGIPPYHNNAVWPFVQSFWLWAAAKTGNEKSVMESISAIYRPAALFLTNKENFVAADGDFSGTQINSSNMLWSLSGNLSLIHKVIFGIEFTTEGLVFHPFVPKVFAGKRSLNNFTCRAAILNIDMEGFGNRVRAFYIDDKLSAKKIIPYSLTGTHHIRIILSDNDLPERTIHSVENKFSPATPVLNATTDSLHWLPVEQALYYSLWKNGKPIGRTGGTGFPVKHAGYGEYQVIAVDKEGLESFASEPFVVMGSGIEQLIEVETYAEKSGLPYKGFNGMGFVEVSKGIHDSISIPVTVAGAGRYAIDVRYSNGNGPVNTENKCAIRTLEVNGKQAGTLVMPQRGKQEWSNWGYSNSIVVQLVPGANRISILYKPYNENMNGEINQAMLDQLRVIALDDK